MSILNKKPFAQFLKTEINNLVLHFKNLEVSYL